MIDKPKGGMRQKSKQRRVKDAQEVRNSVKKVAAKATTKCE